MSEQEPPQKSKDSIIVAFITTLGLIITTIVTTVLGPIVLKCLDLKCLVSDQTHPPTGGAFSGSDILESNGFLRVNKPLFSENRYYRLFCQEDGNVVTRTPNGKIEWNSKSGDKKNVGNVKDCYMQGDGNLVVHDNSDGILWASDTDGNLGAYLRIDDDGHIHIYKKDSKDEIQCNKCRVSPP